MWGNMKTLNLKQSLLLLSATTAFSSCGDLKVTPMPSLQPPVVTKKSNAEFCTPDPASQSTETRILFVIDKSGSNDTTDPAGERRYGAINNFFSKYDENDKIKWGLIEFQNDLASSAFENPYFRAAAEFAPAISSSQAKDDSGSTPYRAAIAQISDAIQDELLGSSSSIKFNFEIVFLSDGMPTDYGQPVDEAKVVSDVQKLVELSVGNVHLSTVYYNLSSTADSSSANRLNNMAVKGFGQYQDASAGQELNFDELIKFGTEIFAFQVKDFFVYNLNTSLCDDGNVGADSDSDGLCDIDEDKYNTRLGAKINELYSGKTFSKTNRNSFHQHYSDFFIYRQLIGEALPSCTVDEAQLDEDSDLLNNCEEKFLTNRSPMGPNQIWTDEMYALPRHSSKTNFDSDGDGILDTLELYFFKEKGLALDYFSLYRNFYGKSQYDLFKDHQSKISPSGSAAYNIDVKHIERKLNGQNCYSFAQENLPLYPVQSLSIGGASNVNLTHGSDENLVLVYYIVVPENDPSSKGILMQSYQRIKFNEGVQSIDVSEGKFTAVGAK